MEALTVDVYDTKGTDLYFTNDYSVQVTTLQEPILGVLVGTLVYGIYNRGTGVREGEARRLPNARMLADNFQAELHSEPSEQRELLLQ